MLAQIASFPLLLMGSLYFVSDCIECSIQLLRYFEIASFLLSSHPCFGLTPFDPIEGIECSIHSIFVTFAQRSPYLLPSFRLSTFIIIGGWDALAKAKEGERENF